MATEIMTEKVEKIKLEEQIKLTEEQEKEFSNGKGDDE